MDEFPCNRCSALCCGPVPLSRDRLDTINRYLSEKPVEEIKRLQRQRRTPSTCKFVDMSTKTCAIYPVRPLLCKDFGRVDHPKAICPIVGVVVNPILPILHDMGMKAEYQSGKAMYSTDFEY